MNKSPAFQFYPSDFLSDENVVLMTNQEVGCYIKLLCFCWKQGSIPNDINKIARLCGESSEAMATLWESIKPCFKLEDGDRIMHARLEKERIKQDKYHERQKKAGKLGAEKRWGNKSLDSTAIATPMAQGMAKNSSSSSSSSSKNIYIEALYKKYISEINPLRKSKQRCIKNLKSIFKKYSANDLEASILNYKSILNGTEPQYRKDPANFFGVNEPFYFDYLPDNFEGPQQPEPPKEFEVPI